MRAAIAPEPPAADKPAAGEQGVKVRPILRFKQIAAAASPAGSRIVHKQPSVGGAALEALRRDQSANNLIQHSQTKIVDCNASAFSSVTKLMSGKRALRKRRTRRFAAEPPGRSMGASQLERDVGDTVISIAMSNDDTCVASPCPEPTKRTHHQ